MKEKKLPQSEREKLKKIIIVFVILFCVMILITVLPTIINANRTKEKQTTEPVGTVVTHAETTQQTTVKEVTGKNGENNTFYPAVVKKIITPTTLLVEKDGKELEVVLIGIEAQENTEADILAFLKTICLDKKVWLQYDEATINENNQEMCYVWLKDGVNPNLYVSCKESMLQGVLIANGLAQPKEEYPNSRYEVIFNLVEKQKQKGAQQ